MPAPDLRARSVSELVDAAVALYRQNAAQYILVAALAYAPLLILQLLLPGALGRTPDAPDAAAGVSFIVTSLASLVTYALVSGAVIGAGSQIYLGHHVDLATIVRETLPRMPALILSGLYRGFFYALGLLLFLVGSLYFIAKYFAVDPAIVIEGKSAGAALSRSADLSKGRKRHILNTLLLVYITYFVLLMGLTIVGALAGSEVVVLVVSSLFTIVVYPVIALTQMLLYYDARIRAEGFDLEHMAGALDAAQGGRGGASVA